MSSLSLFHSIGVPLDVTSEPVDVSGIDSGYGIAIITAPPSELNVFDISVDFCSEVSLLDTHLFNRNLDSANEHIYLTVRTLLDLSDSEQLWVRVKTGDSIVACACLLEF